MNWMTEAVKLGYHYGKYGEVIMEKKYLHQVRLWYKTYRKK